MNIDAHCLTGDVNENKQCLHFPLLRLGCYRPNPVYNIQRPKAKMFSFPFIRALCILFE